MVLSRTQQQQHSRPSSGVLFEESSISSHPHFCRILARDYVLRELLSSIHVPLTGSLFAYGRMRRENRFECAHAAMNDVDRTPGKQVNLHRHM